MPREALSLGFNGNVTSRTSVGVDVYLDRATTTSLSGNPWATRLMVRLVHTLPTGAAYTAGGSGLFRSAPLRAVATVKGLVYADWNANGIQDAGEDPVAGVPLRIEAVGAAESSRNGEFLFKNVPDGLHDVGLDLGALPIDFDAPAIPRLQVALSGHDTRQVAFGLIPLGSIRGRVVRDLNGNGIADSTEPAIDDAVVVLDGGKRSERSKRGKYAFEAVQSGEHSVTLLAESLPDGALIAGEATQVATLGRGRTAIDVPFLVSLEKREEIRKVFPGKPMPNPTRAAAARPRAEPVVTRTPSASGSAAGNVRSPGRRVRRPQPRSPEGGRVEGEGAVGLSRRADGRGAECSLPRAGRPLCQPHRCGARGGKRRTGGRRQGVGDSVGGRSRSR